MRHLCQFARNCALASSRLGVRPLVVTPLLGSTYSWDLQDPEERRTGSGPAQPP